MKSLMERAREGAGAGDGGGGDFRPPDIKPFVPPEMHDTVDRIVAAGVRTMYSPEMRDEVKAALDSPQPLPQRLAENVTGLLLTLDQQVRGGIPGEALFPAGMGLLGEAAEMAQAAGQRVTQSDYNDAARIMFVLVGQKLGGTPEQIMGAAEQAMPGGEQEGGAEDVGESEEKEVGPEVGEDGASGAPGMTDEEEAFPRG